MNILPIMFAQTFKCKYSTVLYNVQNRLQRESSSGGGGLSDPTSTVRQRIVVNMAPRVLWEKLRPCSQQCSSATA